MVFFDHLGQRVDDALHSGDAGVELKPEPHDLKVTAKIARNFLRLDLIGKDFQDPRLPSIMVGGPVSPSCASIAAWMPLRAATPAITLLTSPPV